MKNKKGFTLVEIIGVVVILGIVLGLVSIAYVSINNHIKTTYYKEIETVLLQTAGEYYTYNQGEAPKVFGNNAEVSIATLVNGQYIEEVTDRNGNACDGYVVAYKNSYDRTNYYVCLKCSDYETDNAACRGEVDYSLQMTATVKDTTTRYQEGSFVNDYVTLTFRTFNDVKEIKVENENGDIVKSCNLEIKNDIASCKIQIDETGEYTAYGVSENGTKTDEKEISIKIDNQKPSFDIYENGVLITGKQEKDATSGDINLEVNVLNIRDLESGIKSIRYSFEKEGETNYQTVTTPREEFTIEKTLEIGKYTLIVEIEDNAGNKETKTIEYEVYRRLSIPTTDMYCNDLTYNGTEQELTKPSAEGFTFLNNKGTNAGSYTVRARLNENYRWSDGSNTDKTFTCTINKATPTLTLSATSGSVNAGSTVTFTEKASVAGKFSNVSGTTSVATVSPGSYTGVAANTARTVTVTGVSNGSSKITVTFTPTDTTNYNTRTATYTVTGYRVASTGSCQSRTYNGTSQTLASGGTGVSYSNNTRTNAGSQTVTVTASSGYRFSDNTTSKTLNCSINKKSVAVTWGRTTTFIYNGKAQAPTATASSGVSGETLNITRTTRTNAGSYTSTASLSSVTGGQASTSNYTLTGTTKAFTINKATPTLTLSATSGTVNAGSKVTFTEKASVAGKFSNVSGTTSVATVSPGSYTGVAANTARTVTVTGVSNGSSKITVTFTPTDTTNYNTRTATYTVTGYRVASTGSCQSRTYNGTSQTLASGGTGVSYSNNTRTNAGSQTVTVTASSGYRFSDNTTSKTLNCSINKKSVAVTWGRTTTFIYNGKAQAPTATASSGVSGETLNITRTTRTNPGSYTSTASLSSVTGGQALTSNYTLTGTTKSFKINNATLSGGSVVITGSNEVGSTLTAKVTNTSPTATYKYQWWYSSSSSATSGTNISGATSSTYVPTATYRGYYIGVTVTASKTYYNSKTFNDKTDATNNSYATLVQEVTYIVRHYQMNNDGDDYALVLTTTGTGLVGNSVTPPVKTYLNFTSPSPETITLSATESENVVDYYYTRTCYGEYCGYCTKGSALGQCMYEERSELGLYQSGLTNDEDNYRVIGTKTDQPNNYICFGTTDESKCTNATYLHRIIGVFTDSHQVRLIREEANPSRRFNGSSLDVGHYHYSTLATVSFSSIPTTPTFGWATTINGSTKWSDIVVDRTFGEIHNKTAYTYTAEHFLYIDEAVFPYCSGSYKSKAYPIALSDLLLSTGSTTLTFQYSYNTIKNSWLLLGSDEWTYQMFNTSHAWVISSGGKLCANDEVLSSYCSKVSGYLTTSKVARTNFQLHQNALFCGGDGSKTNPIILGWGSCTN